MSFQLFLFQLTGKIKPTEQIENQRETLRKDFEVFQEVEKSEELKHFFELEKWVQSGAVKQKKAEIVALKFKGSREFKQLREYVKLKKSAHIKRYFRAVDSAELTRYNNLKKSEKLQEYDLLLEYVKEGQFQKDKREIESQTFKGSVEEKHLNDFQRLKKSAGIKAWLELFDSDKIKSHKEFGESEKLKKFVRGRNAPEMDKIQKKEFRILKHDREIKEYFRFERSKKLKLYLETEGSHDLKRFLELKQYVESEEFKKREIFLKDKKKFENSEVNKKHQRFKKIAADTDVKFFLKYEKSGLYKNYLDVKDSFDLKRFIELEGILNSEEYKNRKAYLEDTRKWEKTEEFARFQKYLEIKKQPHMLTYFKYKNSAAFDFLKNWEVVFEDNFEGTVLNRALWSTKSYQAEKLGENYAMPGDLHITTNGENISVAKKLSIEIKQENLPGKIWQANAGFVPAEFNYSSGLVSSANSFWMENGIVEAKIKFKPLKQVLYSFYLAGKNNLPRLTLLEMGAKNRVGIVTLASNGKTELNGTSISNLKKGKWYIFSIERQNNQFTWKINEKEICSVNGSDLEKTLHLNASGMVVYNIPGSEFPVTFDIEWVKSYRKK